MKEKRVYEPAEIKIIPFNYFDHLLLDSRNSGEGEEFPFPWGD